MADDPDEEAVGPRALALLQPGDKILVTVESALPDILVVTYQHADKSFQGALLDATKRGLPCGVQPPEPVKGPDGDKLATIAARFSYFQEKRHPVLGKTDQRRNLQSPARTKTTRPTVRLRPRQVLCSKCRSICNENSESVGRKRKLEEASPSEPPTRRSDRRCNSQQQQQQPQPQPEAPSLLPVKVEPLRPDSSCGQETAPGEVSSWAEAESSGRPMSAQPMELEGHQLECRATPRRLSSSSVESAKVPPAAEETATSTTTTTSRRVPRKKRSVGLMEDLWDESVFEEPAAARPTPVIKISFGAQGEGTVLKIPPRMRSAYCSEEDEEEERGQPERDPLELPEGRDAGLADAEDAAAAESLRYQAAGAALAKDCETPSSKAAKKALKKAKKKALRKMYGAASPARSPCNGSPRYQASLDKMLYHRRKHKVKHKKRHKEERKHKGQAPSVCVEGEAVVPQPQAGECGPLDDSAYTAIKEQCLRQKLSISLKRLNTNAYAARCGQLGYPASSASSGCKSPGATSDDEPGHGDEGDDEDDDEEGESAAGGDFSAAPEHPLVVRLAASAGPVGRRMDVGDVVWGKVHGFPWWPGKVLSITDSCKEDGTPLGPQAHVAWYGSSTSSLMSCDQLSPFLETFKTRYNKKKKGPYKEAIRQAQSEARSQIGPSSTTPSVLGVCGSPREVNVLS